MTTAESGRSEPLFVDRPRPSLWIAGPLGSAYLILLSLLYVGAAESDRQGLPICLGLAVAWNALFLWSVYHVEYAIEPNHLRVRIGLLWNARIPMRDIREVRPLGSIWDTWWPQGVTVTTNARNVVRIDRHRRRPLYLSPEHAYEFITHLEAARDAAQRPSAV